MILIFPPLTFCYLITSSAVEHSLFIYFYVRLAGHELVLEFIFALNLFDPYLSLRVWRH